MDEQDRIEREITIDASVERVWAMVSEPGWWIGDGDRTGQRRSREGEVHVIEDPKYGRFPIKVISSDPPSYVSYQSLPDTPEAGEGSTLVEFWVVEKDGAVVVRVVESGFASLAVSPQERRRRIDGNTDGWRQQLGILRRDATTARQ